MGDKKTSLNWQWPLISLEWLPEILGSFNQLLEPSWVGLQRELIANVPNQSFGKRIFSQLQLLLLETNIIVEDDRYIKVTTEPNRQCIVDHLKNLFDNSFEPWANYYRYISSQKISLSSLDLNKDRLGEWNEINKYSIFKQWTAFFQFIGLGVFIENEKFIPESVFKPINLNNKLFIEKCIKSHKDPRILSGQYSLHTEADFLAWTKGEDNLPISSDPKLSVRIPYEIFSIKSGLSINKKILEAITYWNNQVNRSIKNAFRYNLERLIVTQKIFLDYFLFGHLSYELEFISNDSILIIKEKWKKTEYYNINENIWRIIPRLYNNITRLTLGILYFRNSLKKIIDPWTLYNEDLLNEDSTDAIRSLPIRSYHTKRKLTNFMDNITAINKSVEKIIDKNINMRLEKYITHLCEEANNFITNNVIEIDSIIFEASKMITINNEEVSGLKKELPLYFLSDCPKHKKLATCYWVHRMDDIEKHPKTITIKSLKKKVFDIENQLKLEIDYYEKDMDKWNEAYSKMKEKIRIFPQRIV